MLKSGPERRKERKKGKKRMLSVADARQPQLHCQAVVSVTRRQGEVPGPFPRLLVFEDGVIRSKPGSKHWSTCRHAACLIDPGLVFATIHQQATARKSSLVQWLELCTRIWEAWIQIPSLEQTLSLTSLICVGMGYITSPWGCLTV